MKKALIAVLFFNIVNAQAVTSTAFPVNGEKYITGDDGVVRMYINVWGHVKTSGTFLIFEGADLFNALSLAGGPLEGANLKKVQIVSKKNGDSVEYNLSDFIRNNSGNKFKLNPYDTIIIKQTVGSKILNRSNLITAIFQLANLLYTIDRLD
tara:strand:+ start:138 stop:593 length:456 start_codon:yes stop_codon:yes gene_type:complete